MDPVSQWPPVSPTWCAVNMVHFLFTGMADLGVV